MTSGTGEQLLERLQAHCVPQDQLTDPGAPRLGQNRRVLVDQLPHRVLEVVAAHAASGRLGATPLDQPPPQIRSQRLPVAVGRIRASVNPGGNAPRPRTVASKRGRI